MGTHNAARSMLREKRKWLALIAITLICFFTMFYDDLYITYQHGLLLLDCTFEGRFFDFYTRSIEMAPELNNFNANYYLPIYLLFAIWALPCWLLSRLAGIDPAAPFCLLWMKCLILTTFIGCMFLANRILKEWGSENRELWLYALCTSLFVFPTVIMGFYDTIELLFALTGFLLLSKEENASVRALLLLSLAISMKPIMIFPIALWVLLKEKRILYLLRAALILGSISIVSVMLFWPSFRQVTSSLQDSMVLRLFSITAPANMYPLSLFCVVFFAAAALALFRKQPDDCRGFIRDASWITTLYCFGFSLFVLNVHPQWMVTVIPFAIFLAASREEALAPNMILLSLAEAAAFFLQTCFYYWVFMTHEVFERLLLKNAPRLHALTSHDANMSVVIEKLGLAPYLPGVTALFAVALAGLLLVNFPSDWLKRGKALSFSDWSNWNPSSVVRAAYAYRTIVLALFLIASLSFAFVV